MSAKYGTFFDFVACWFCILVGLVVCIARGIQYGFLGAIVGALCGWLLGLAAYFALACVITGVYWVVRRIGKSSRP